MSDVQEINEDFHNTERILDRLQPNCKAVRNLSFLSDFDTSNMTWK